VLSHEAKMNEIRVYTDVLEFHSSRVLNKSGRKFDKIIESSIAGMKGQSYTPQF